MAILKSKRPSKLDLLKARLVNWAIDEYPQIWPKHKDSDDVVRLRVENSINKLAKTTNMNDLTDAWVRKVKGKYENS